MKLNWKSIFGSKKSSSELITEEYNEKHFDKHVDFFYSNLINSLILFTYKTDKLEELAGPVFDPIAELKEEIEYAFTPVCFETIVRNGLIDKSYKADLLSFKQKIDGIPAEIWEWECIDNNNIWIEIRKEANELLDKLGVSSREYSEDYTTVYDNVGRVLKKGKNCS